MTNIKYGDLTGKRFGRLKVVGPAEPHTFPSGQIAKQWRCHCDCGKDAIVLQRSLTSGHTKSCGCQSTTLGHRWAKDLTGQQFGDLEVIERAGISKRKAPLWRCLCHRCGQEIILEGYKLTDKKSPRQDCGCRLRERYADLSGQTFGALEVLNCTGAHPSGDKAYLCRCSVCGKEKVFPASAIRIGLKSCGCRQYETVRMAKMSALGVEKNIVDGVNLNSVFKKEASKASKTGVRGVYPDSARPGQYRASCMVHGELWVRAGFLSIESAKKARDEAQAQLIKKYNVKNPKKDTERSTK